MSGENEAGENRVFRAYQLRGQKCRRNRRGSLTFTRLSPGGKGPFSYTRLVALILQCPSGEVEFMRLRTGMHYATQTLLIFVAFGCF